MRACICIVYIERLLRVQKDEVAAIYALATACMMQKNLPRARNVLKRLARAPWNAEVRVPRALPIPITLYEQLELNEHEDEEMEL